jgi:exodeoxyribonuclease-3
MRPCTLWSWNVNGIRAVIKDGTFGTFMEKAAPKVLCLNETKIDSHALEKDGVISHLSKWFPRGLQFWNCCKNKKGYSGTAILIADDFEGGKPSKVEYDFGKPGEHDQEGRVVTAYFDKFTLVASYVPNSGVIDLGRLDYRVKQWDKDL